MRILAAAAAAMMLLVPNVCAETVVHDANLVSKVKRGMNHTDVLKILGEPETYKTSDTGDIVESWVLRVKSKSSEPNLAHVNRAVNSVSFGLWGVFVEPMMFWARTDEIQKISIVYNASMNVQEIRFE